MAMDKLLELMAEKRASDLFITVGSPIQLKLNGVTVPVNQNRLEQHQQLGAEHVPRNRDSV